MAHRQRTGDLQIRIERHDLRVLSLSLPFVLLVCGGEGGSGGGGGGVVEEGELEDGVAFFPFFRPFVGFEDAPAEGGGAFCAGEFGDGV